MFARMLVCLLSMVIAGEIPLDLLILIEKAKAARTVDPKPAPKVTPKAQVKKAIVYQQTIKRIERPAGFRAVYVYSDGDSRETLLAHVKRTHGALLKDVLAHVSIDGFSRHDLLMLHSLIHCQEWGWTAPRPLGSWKTECPADPNLPCVQTFIWELPR